MTSSVTLGSTFVFGLLHALEPGHGKSFLMSYSIGEKLKFKQILSLGGSMLVSHFLMLTVLTLLFQFVLGQSGQEVLLKYRGWGIPIFVIGFGLFLLFRYYRNKQKGIECDCGAHHAQGHPHLSPQPSPMKGPMNLQSAPMMSGPIKVNTAAIKQPEKTKNPILAGLISGLIPCPSVIAPLTMVSLNGDFSQSLMYLLVYVLGMSLVMTGLIAVFYFAKDFAVSKMNKFSGKFDTRLIAAVMVIAVGFGYLAVELFSQMGGGHVH